MKLITRQLWVQAAGNWGQCRLGNSSLGWENLCLCRVFVNLGKFYVPIAFRWATVSPLGCPGIVPDGCRILILEPQVLLLLKGKPLSKSLILSKRDGVGRKQRDLSILDSCILCMATSLKTFDDWCLQCYCFVAFNMGLMLYTASISSDYLCAWWGWWEL